MSRDVVAAMRAMLSERGLAGAQTPCLLMVSGGSDSTALAYAAAELRDAGDLGPVAALHVNHCLRGAESDDDAAFVERLADALGIPLFLCEIDIARMVDEERGNMEAIARRERYATARDALRSHCAHWGFPFEAGRIFVAHTADDRVENFYMRSIVGTGPGGFRSMDYVNGQVVRPLLDVSRADLRRYIESRESVVRDESGALWRDDSTNAASDHFRNYVRHEIVPAAKSRNPQLLETLTRTMNLIADEDDLLQKMARNLLDKRTTWIEPDEAAIGDYTAGCVLAPGFAGDSVALARRVVFELLERLLGADARVESAAVEAVLAACEGGAPKSGYVANIQGDLAVSANKAGIRIEPMAAFRARRKRK